jgi:hypothetical protein
MKLDAGYLLYKLLGKFSVGIKMKSNVYQRFEKFLM